MQFLCSDYAKRCLLSFCLNTGDTLVQAENQGVCHLARCQLRAQAQTYPKWVASLFCVKTRGLGRGDSVTLIRVLCQKAVQSQRIFPVA